MTGKPTYEELERRVKELEKEDGKRKEAEEELRKYQFMIESAHDAIFFKDLGSRYITANDKTLGAFGLSREDVIGKNDYELMPDQEEAKKNVHDDQIVFKSGKPKEVFKHMTRADGKKYWFQAIKVPQFDNDGKVIGLVGIARDITKRKQAEEALRKEKDKAQKYLNIAGVIIVVLNVDQTVGLINTKGCEILGHEESEIVGKNWFDNFLPENDRKRARAVFFELITENIEPIEFFENAVLTKDNEERLIAWHNAVLRNNEGKIIATLSSGEDVTDRKRAEVALRKAHDELEHRVKERTKELEIKTRSLEELNTAMKVLLKKREEDKEEIQDNVMTNVKELIAPFFKKIKRTELDNQQKTFLSIIESNLNEIISPFTRKMSLKYLNLTPTEIQIANLIKHGSPSKKIAELMNVSPRTIDTHRKNIRRKIGIQGQRGNLRSYLLSLY